MSAGPVYVSFYEAPCVERKVPFVSVEGKVPRGSGRHGQLSFRGAERRGISLGSVEGDAAPWIPAQGRNDGVRQCGGEGPLAAGLRGRSLGARDDMAMLSFRGAERRGIFLAVWRGGRRPPGFRLKAGMTECGRVEGKVPRGSGRHGGGGWSSFRGALRPSTLRQAQDRQAQDVSVQGR